MYSGPPKLLERAESNIESYAGETVKLVCRVAGNPIALIDWSKDGVPIRYGYEEWDRFSDRGSSLKISDMSVEDSGDYVCRAVNGFGSVFMNFTLEVLGKYCRGDIKG